MSAHHYQALSKSGKTTKGVIDADSERHARQLLRDRGLIPIQIRVVTKQAEIKQKNKLSASDLTLLTRQLATLVAAGIPLEESLLAASEQTEKSNVRGLILSVREKVLEGYSLAQAMSKFPKTFPELYCATVSAGELSSHLDLVLEKLADYTESQQTVKQKIQHALIYPCLMMAVSTLIIFFLMIFVVPKIIEVFTNSGQSLPLMTRILIRFSQFISSYGGIGLLLIVSLLAGFKMSLSNHKVRFIWHRLLLRVPISSYLVKSINVARYIHTFGILFAAGGSVLETMRISSSLVSNQIMREAFDRAQLRVKEGSGISTALKETHFLSPLAIQLIASGEKTGQVSAMMNKAASQIDQDLKHLIDTTLTLLEPLIILFMGVVVLFIVLATLLPIFSMEQLVT